MGTRRQSFNQNARCSGAIVFFSIPDHHNVGRGEELIILVRIQLFPKSVQLGAGSSCRPIRRIMKRTLDDQLNRIIPQLARRIHQDIKAFFRTRSSQKNNGGWGC
jgi:hypothetical protein